MLDQAQRITDAHENMRFLLRLGLSEQFSSLKILEKILSKTLLRIPLICF